MTRSKTQVMSTEHINLNNSKKRKLATIDESEQQPAKKTIRQFQTWTQMKQNQPLITIQTYINKLLNWLCTVQSVGQENSAQAESAVSDSLELHTPLTLAWIDFNIGEVVWAEIKGYPHWPAKIKSFPTTCTAEVVWFNDYRTTEIFCSQIFKFLIHFGQFATRFTDRLVLKLSFKKH